MKTYFYNFAIQVDDMGRSKVDLAVEKRLSEDARKYK